MLLYLEMLLSFQPAVWFSQEITVSAVDKLDYFGAEDFFQPYAVGMIFVESEGQLLRAVARE